MKFLKTLPACPAAWGLIALVFFVSQLSGTCHPGASASYLAGILGVWSSPGIETHPLATLFYSAAGGLFSIKAAISICTWLTAVLGAFGICLAAHLAARTVRYFGDEPRSKEFTARAAGWAVAGTAITLMLTPVYLRASTHVQWQIPDFVLLGCALLMTLRTAENGSMARLTVAAFVWGLLFFEAPMFVLLAPLGLLALLIGYVVERNAHSDRKVGIVPPLVRIAVATGLGATLLLVAAASMSLAAHAEAGFFGTAIRLAKLQILAVMGFTNGSWLLMLLTGILPFFLALFGVRTIASNRRRYAILFTYLTLVVLICLSVIPGPLSLSTLSADWHGTYPVLFAAMTALAVGLSLAAGVFLFRVRRRPEGETSEPASVRRLGALLSCAASAAVLSIAVGFGTYHTVRAIRADRPLELLPRLYAEALLGDRNSAPAWLLGDGASDPMLALFISANNIPTRFFSLTRDNEKAMTDLLRAGLKEDTVIAANADLAATLDRSLDIGIIPFIQDWLRIDPKAVERFASVSLPDLWYTGNRLPLPAGLLYRGASDRANLHRRLPTTVVDFRPDFLPPQPRTEDSPADPLLRDFEKYVRRQYGFVANNLGFFLADAGRTEEAYQLFRSVYAWDPENISALFNIFEIINGGAHLEDRAWCEKEINNLIKKLAGRKYRLWALSRTYGYIRSPQLISQLAGAWAMSGQTGAALSGYDMAYAMLDDGKRAGFNQAVTALYSITPGKRAEAIRRIREELKRSTDPKRSLAYLRDLIRMSILENDTEEAKRLLRQAESVAGQGSPDIAYERALLFASLGDTAKARIALQIYLDKHPRNADAVATLATLQLQDNELDELTEHTLPRLITLAGTEDDYFVLIIRAQLAEKNTDFRKARTAYLRALALKPEVHALRDTVLRLDIRLNDRAAAAEHARQFLYQDRTLPLANYIMGAIALSEDNLVRAKSYLETATAPEVKLPLPEAFNDLAETYRRLGDWTAALSAAQQSTKLAPKLAIAHETAASALLELGRTAEAHEELDRAMSIEKEVNPKGPADPRIFITRARVCLKEKQAGLARAALAEARKQYDTLDERARKEFDSAAKAANLK